MDRISKVLIIIGITALTAGVLARFWNKLPGLGKLPGDFIYRKGDFTFYFPLTTGIVLSVIISLILAILSRVKL